MFGYSISKPFEKRCHSRQALYSVSPAGKELITAYLVKWWCSISKTPNLSTCIPNCLTIRQITEQPTYTPTHPTSYYHTTVDKSYTHRILWWRLCRLYHACLGKQWRCTSAFLSPTEKIVILGSTAFGGNSGIQAAHNVHKEPWLLKQNKSHISQNPKGKGDIPFMGQTGYRHRRTFESLCNRGQKLAAHKDWNAVTGSWRDSLK